jgi:hypothetical protein
MSQRAIPPESSQKRLPADCLGGPSTHSPRRGDAFVGQGASDGVYGLRLRPGHLEDAPHYGHLCLVHKEAVLIRRESKVVLRIAPGDYLTGALARRS